MGTNVAEINHCRIKKPILHIVLYQPEIPSNTGNIARLCAAALLPLHLIHPLGFKLDDKHLKRAGLDYWPEVDLREHLSFEEFVGALKNDAQILCFSTHATQVYTQARVSQGAFLVFGPETRGLPLGIRSAYPCYKVPIWGKVRSLNLSTTVGIVAYHYLSTLRGF